MEFELTINNAIYEVMQTAKGLSLLDQVRKSVGLDNLDPSLVEPLCKAFYSGFSEKLFLKESEARNLSLWFEKSNQHYISINVKDFMDEKMIVTRDPEDDRIEKVSFEFIVNREKALAKATEMYNNSTASSSQSCVGISSRTRTEICKPNY